MSSPFDNVLNSEEFVEEFFVASIQSKLQELLDDKGLNRSDLAQLLDVSKPRISQIFSDQCNNLTVRLLARAFSAMEEEPILLTKKEYALLVRNCAESSTSFQPKNVHWEIDDGEHISEALLGSIIKSALVKHSKDADSVKNPPKRRASNSTSLEWNAHNSNVVPLRKRMGESHA